MESEKYYRLCFRYVRTMTKSSEMRNTGFWKQNRTAGLLYSICRESGLKLLINYMEKLQLCDIITKKVVLSGASIWNISLKENG